MQNPNEVEAELLAHKNALLLHNLSVKQNRTPEEDEIFKNLLLAQLATVNRKPEDVFGTSESIIVPDCGELPDSEEPHAVVKKTSKIPTLAAHVTKDLNPGAVKVKRVMNGEYPDEKLGSSHTPVKTVVRDITNSFFSLSPGGTTATYEHTVKVAVKKVSGGQFVKPVSEDDDTESLGNNSSLSSSQ